MRRRSTVFATAVLTASLTLVSGLVPFAAQAADTPDAAVNEVLDVILSKQTDQLGPLVCEAYRDQVVEEMDFTQILGEMPEGVDVQAFVDGLTLSIDGREVTVVSEEGDDAVVHLAGTLKIEIDEEVAREFVKLVMEAMGAPVDDATIDQMLPLLLEEMSGGTDMTSDLDVVREDGEWLVCDDLSTDEPDGSFDPNASPGPVADALCDLVSPEEISALSPVVFSVATPQSGGCSYGPDEASGDFYTVDIRLEDGNVEDIKAAFGDGQELTVAGFPAFGNDTALWTDIGDQLFTVQPILWGVEGSEELDLVAYAASIAELAIPRLQP